MLYALLVGINDYKSNDISNLSGCKGDVFKMKSFLEKRFPKEEERKIQTLWDFKAKKHKIIDWLGTSLFEKDGEFTPPQKDDIVLFFFSGHGSQEPAPKEFGGGKNETFLCHDSRHKGETDLADKEIAALMAKIAVNDPHLVLIFDSCHSGSITRGEDDLKLGKARFSPASKTPRPLNTYLPDFYPETENEPAQGYYERMWKEQGERGELSPPPAPRHILLSACERSEKAYELASGENGVFTSTLLKMLENESSISYATLFSRSRATIRHWAHNQSPQFETYRGFSPYFTFLSNKKNNAPIPVSVRLQEFDPNNDKRLKKPYWVIEKGAIHGIPTDVKSNILVEVYKEGKLETKGQITEVMIDFSRIEFPDIDEEGYHGVTESMQKMQNADEEGSLINFTGIISSLPGKPLLVGITGGEKEEYPKIKEALNGRFPLLFSNEKTDYHIDIEKHRQDDKFSTFKVIHTDSKTQIGGAIGKAGIVGGYLNNEIFGPVYRWTAFNELQNSNPKLKQDLVSLELITYKDEEVSQIFEEKCTLLCDKVEDDGDITWDSKEYKVRITNHTKQPLYVNLFELTPTYAFYPLGNQMEIKDGRSEFFKFLYTEDDGSENESEWNVQYIPDVEEHPKDVSESIYKLIVSTNRFDDFLYEQDELDFTHIEDLTNRDRASKNKRKGPKIVRNDWFTKKLDISLIRNIKQLDPEKGGNSSGEEKEEVELANGKISFEHHDGLSATLSMQSAETHSKGESVSLIPKIMEGMGMEAINFSEDERDVVNVLELSNMQKASTVSEDNPLRMSLKLPEFIKEGETVMPFVFDGEHILPVGKMVGSDADKVKIEIDQIPKENTRKKSPVRAMKLVLGRMFLGWNSDKLYQLRWVDYSGEKPERKDKDLKKKVEKAHKILICIHGIIGDTVSIIPAAQHGLKSEEHPEGYDLILTYDYENLKGPIEEIASQLKTKLRENAGIDVRVKKTGSEKTVDILAHSMGGLVSRWFIEQEGGNEIINRLILAGTPNGGSPFGKAPQYIDLAITALTLGMNIPFLQGFAPLAGGLAGVLGATKALTPTLKQMHEDSPFLRELNNSPDPKIPYIILAGNLMLYEDMLDKLEAQGLSVKTMMEKAKINVGKAFKDDNNDIAVTVESIRNIPEGREMLPFEPQPELACHHLNYFEMKERNPSWHLLKNILTGKEELAN